MKILMDNSFWKFTGLEVTKCDGGVVERLTCSKTIGLILGRGKNAVGTDYFINKSEYQKVGASGTIMHIYLLLQS